VSLERLTDRSREARKYFVLVYFVTWAVLPGSLWMLYCPKDSETELTSFSAYDNLESSPSRISAYDEMIHKYARTYNLDWRLVSSIIYTESSFRHDAVSPAGAKGLMQIMPAVAREQGVEIPHLPDENVRAGIAHFSKLFQQFRGVKGMNGLTLALAAYNAGLGHVRDAQRLVKEMNLNHRQWKNVEKGLLLLEDPEYYDQAKHGYCRGSETTEYVSRVLTRYSKYRALYPTRPVQATTSASRSDYDT